MKKEHALDKAIYHELAKTIEKNPFGIPRVNGEISEAFIDFLSLIYTPEEAELARYLNVYPMFKTVAQIAERANRVCWIGWRCIPHAHFFSA